MRVFAWTNHFLILAGSKTDEAWEFYMNLCIKRMFLAKLP